MEVPTPTRYLRFKPGIKRVLRGMVHGDILRSALVCMNSKDNPSKPNQKTLKRVEQVANWLGEDGLFSRLSCAYICQTICDHMMVRLMETKEEDSHVVQNWTLHKLASGQVVKEMVREIEMYVDKTGVPYCNKRTPRKGLISTQGEASPRSWKQEPPVA